MAMKAVVYSDRLLVAWMVNAMGVHLAAWWADDWAEWRASLKEMTLDFQKATSGSVLAMQMVGISAE